MASSGRALLHIGGGPLQLYTVAAAKELGVYVVVTDLDPRAPASDIADEMWQVSGTDTDELVRLAEVIAAKRGLIGAYASSDFGLMSVALIHQRLGLPACSPTAVARALDKSTASSVLADAGIAVPRSTVLPNDQDAGRTVTAWGLPAVIKPVGSSGSRGVTVVTGVDQVPGALKYALEFSDRVILEQFIAGAHVDVNGYFVDDRFVPCGVMDREFIAQGSAVSIRGAQPSILDERIQEECTSLLERSSRALGITCGPVKADMIVDVSGPVVLEVTPRFHGDVLTSYMTPVATRCSPARSYFASLAHLDEADQACDLTVLSHAGWRALYAQSRGTVSAIRGLEEAAAVDGVSKVLIRTKVGSSVRPPVDNRDILGFVWARAETRLLMIERLERAAQCVSFEVA